MEIEKIPWEHKYPRNVPPPHYKPKFYESTYEGNRGEQFLARNILKVFDTIWKKAINPLEFGLYPKEYNPKVHGPYVPFRYYGKADVPFGELKLAEVLPWIKRREKGINPFMRMVSRAHWRWSWNYFNAKYLRFGFFWQLFVSVSLLSAVTRYNYVWRKASLRTVQTGAEFSAAVRFRNMSALMIYSKMVKRGVLVVLEGCDRSGKSTQASLLADWLNDNGYKAKYIKFPDRTTNVGKCINEYLSNTSNLSDESAHLLFSANRWELKENMLSDLRNSTTLIVDRYAFSGVAFSAAKGLDFQWCCFPDRGLPKPDLVLYFDIPSEVCEQRDGFGQERYETREFQQKVRKCYQKLWDDTTWKRVKADDTIESVHEILKTQTLSCMELCSDLPVETLWTNSLPSRTCFSEKNEDVVPSKKLKC